MTTVTEAVYASTSVRAGESASLRLEESASLRAEERIPHSLKWPRFKTGSTLQPSSFGEEVELADSLPSEWSTNVLEKPLFAGQFLVLERKPSLWDKLARLRSIVPPEERGRYPTDGARNLDRYLYRPTGRP